MQNAKLNVLFAFFPYGGNGGISSEHPSIRRWFADTLLQCKVDDRIGEIATKDYCDTPIPMTRNQAIREGREIFGSDIIVMCDSDNHPDLYLGQAGAKPFWKSSFDFLYERKMRGELTMVGAPYCGPPPLESVYVFKFANWQNENPNVDFRIEMFSREEAAMRAGMEMVPALPTGLIMIDLAIYDHVEPPYFYYEFSDNTMSQKDSTEDVTGTRDVCLFINEKFGYNPVYVNWDAWAGHWKPKCVGKPQALTVDQIGQKYQRAMLHGAKSNQRVIEVSSAGKKAFQGRNLRGNNHAESGLEPVVAGAAADASGPTGAAEADPGNRTAGPSNGEARHTHQGQGSHAVQGVAVEKLGRGFITD